MGLTDQIKKTALKTAIGYLEKNPEENAPKLMAWAGRTGGGTGLPEPAGAWPPRGVPQ